MPLARSPYLRTAFDLALDRTAINRVVFNGTNLPDCYPISPASPWYAKTTKGLECNLRGEPEPRPAARARLGGARHRSRSR